MCEARLYSSAFGQSRPVVLLNLTRSSIVTTCVSHHVTYVHGNTQSDLYVRIWVSVVSRRRARQEWNPNMRWNETCPAGNWITVAHVYNFLFHFCNGRFPTSSSRCTSSCPICLWVSLRCFFLFSLCTWVLSESFFVFLESLGWVRNCKACWEIRLYKYTWLVFVRTVMMRRGTPFDCVFPPDLG